MTEQFHAPLIKGVNAQHLGQEKRLVFVGGKQCAQGFRHHCLKVDQ